MNPLVRQIVDKLLDDTEFITQCEEKLNEIMEDKKFDFKDTPHVISLVVLVVDKYDDIKIKKENVVETFKVLTMELLKRVDALDDCQEQIEAMLDSCLQLLVMKVNTGSIINSIKNKCCPKKK